MDHVRWLDEPSLHRPTLIAAFTDRGVKHCVMAGQIAPKNLFDLRPDLRAVALLMRLKEKNAHTIFGGIADELQKDGVELISAVPWLQPLEGTSAQARRHFDFSVPDGHAGHHGAAAVDDSE